MNQSYLSRKEKATHSHSRANGLCREDCEQAGAAGLSETAMTLP